MTQEIEAVLIASESFRSFRKANRGIISVGAAVGSLAPRSKAMPYPQTVETMAAAMTRAQAADRVGDQSGCEQALADAQRTLGP